MSNCDELVLVKASRADPNWPCVKKYWSIEQFRLLAFVLPVRIVAFALESK